MFCNYSGYLQVGRSVTHLQQYAVAIIFNINYSYIKLMVQKGHFIVVLTVEIIIKLTNRSVTCSVIQWTFVTQTGVGVRRLLPRGRARETGGTIPSPSSVDILLPGRRLDSGDRTASQERRSGTG